MVNDEYFLRREKLMEQMGPNSIAIFKAANEYLRTGSSVYPYRQESDFYYLTGFDESDAVVVLIPGRPEGEFVLFSKVRDPSKEIWTGRIVGQEGACAEFGVDQAHPISLLDDLMPQLLAGKKTIYFKIGREAGFDARVMDWVSKLRAGIRDGAQAPTDFVNVEKVLHEMRVRKSKSELQIMRRAADITAKAFLLAMQQCSPNMYEYELEAILLHEFTREGGRYQAFETIVGGGANACTLHYCKNNEVLTDGELVLLDAGIEYEFYSADITRTFPINGKFSPEQKAIYQVVLNAQQAVIEMVKPGIRWNQLQQKAEEVITQGLVALGLLQGDVAELVEKKAFKPFFMHKIGHFMGIDDHDVGEYKPQNAWRILEPGMVFSVEPGVYIGAGLTWVDPKWWNIGVRIEDDILVTEDGYENLTAGVPKTVHEVEAVMQTQLKMKNEK